MYLIVDHLIISLPWVTKGGLEVGSRISSCLIRRCADFGDGFYQEKTDWMQKMKNCTFQ